MQVVLPDGEITELGGKIVKNSSGYSLLDLLIGSEGTLGILTRVTLKLISEPRVNLSLLVPSRIWISASRRCPRCSTAESRQRWSSWSARSSRLLKTTLAAIFPTTARMPTF